MDNNELEIEALKQEELDENRYDIKFLFNLIEVVLICALCGVVYCILYSVWRAV